MPLKPPPHYFRPSGRGSADPTPPHFAVHSAVAHSIFWTMLAMHNAQREEKTAAIFIDVHFVHLFPGWN